jgi:hypothetical protein
MISPVMNEDASEARKHAAAATSSAFPCALQGYVIQKFVNVLASQTQEHLGFDACRCDRVDANVIRTAFGPESREETKSG